MCLSTLFIDTAAEPVGKNICKIRVEGDHVVASDIMGREITLCGTIEDIDLVENVIRVRAAA